MWGELHLALRVLYMMYNVHVHVCVHVPDLEQSLCTCCPEVTQQTGTWIASTVVCLPHLAIPVGAAA